MTERERASLITQGTQILTGAYAKTYEALFVSAPIGRLQNHEQNDYARLPRGDQMIIVQQSLVLSLAQSVASSSILSGVGRKKVLQQAVAALADRVEDYYQAFEEEKRKDEGRSRLKAVDVGTQAGNVDQGSVPGNGDDDGADKKG
jgi:hypothetical protein